MRGFEPGNRSFNCRILAVRAIRTVTTPPLARGYAKFALERAAESSRRAAQGQTGDKDGTTFAD